MRAVRNTIAASIVGCALAAGHGAGASTASSSLAVTVRVLRSCAVQARPVDSTSAAVTLKCSAGHDSSVLVSDGQLAPPRGVVHVAGAGDEAGDATVRTITLNF